MDYALAAIGSITTAVKLKKAIMRTGVVTPSVVHTPSEINKGGCSYSLRFKQDYIPIVKRSAENVHIIIKGLFLEVQNGEEREYRAIS